MNYEIEEVDIEKPLLNPSKEQNSNFFENEKNSAYQFEIESSKFNKENSPL